MAPLPSELITLELAEAIKTSPICEMKPDKDLDFGANGGIPPPDSLDESEDIGRIIALGKTQEYLDRKKKESEAGTSKPKPPNVSLEFNDIEYNGEAVHVGLSRFEAGNALLGAVVDVTDAIHACINGPAIDDTRRLDLWENVIIVGRGSRIHGLREQLWMQLKRKYEFRGNTENYAANLAVAQAQATGAFPVQINAPLAPQSIMAPRQILEYFIHWRERGEGGPRFEEISFLGGCLVSKASFSDSTGSMFTSREDYNERGPKAILT